jgi:RHS repeat-associated protein
MSYTYGTTGKATGHVTSFTYPSGNRVHIGYGNDGRPNNIWLARPGSTDLVPLLTDIVYRPFGGVANWSWGNSTAAAQNIYTRKFDLDGRIVSFPLGHPGYSGVVRTLHYDAAGRITAITHSGSANAASLDQRYYYDDLDRLTGFEAEGTAQSYNYDKNGNRIQAAFGNASYTNTISATSNRLNSTTGPLPAKKNSYDAAGNLISDGMTSYKYNASGRMESASSGGAITEYRYNGLGERVAKIGMAGATTYYIYDEQGQLLGEYNRTGAIQETVYLGDFPVAVITPQTEGTLGIYYVYADHLRAPRVITRASDNKMVWRWDRADPFGLFQPDEDPIGLGKFTYNLRFPGQLFDKESNNHYNYFRDYDPLNARYIQSDPSGLDGGMNTYSYVEGDPVNKVDPTGEVAFVPIVVGIGAGIAFDYVVSEWKKKNCACRIAETPAGPVGNGALGGVIGLFGPFDSKPRTGVSGGGPSTTATSIFSKINHAAANSGFYSTSTRHAVTSIARKVPFASAAVAAFEIYDALSCN